MPAETLWRIEPHTKAKHEILRRYLEAWFPIMLSWNTKILFLDGFAGPGVYANGEPGSPRIAIDAAIKNNRDGSDATTMCLFNENHKDRFATLDSWCKNDANPPNNIKLFTRNQEFADLAQGVVDSRGGRVLVPTFAFVDPFGFKGVPIDLICSLVRDKRSELFILFSFNSVNRWIGHPKQQENMKNLFGCYDYRKAEGMDPSQRKAFLASLYEDQLKKHGGFEYVSRFEMIESNGRTSYFLYHCTRSLKGLEVMRTAMWKIDKLEGRQFSDRVAGLDSILDEPLQFDLEQRLSTHYAGRVVSIEDVQKFVLTDTPFAPEHLKVPTLKPMQQAGKIECFNQRRRGTFPAGVTIKFL